MIPRILFLISSDWREPFRLLSEFRAFDFVEYPTGFTSDQISRYLETRKREYDAVAVFSHERAIRSTVESCFSGPKILLNSVGGPPADRSYVMTVNLAVGITTFNEQVASAFSEL